jgi:hypothetical protein
MEGQSWAPGSTRLLSSVKGIGVCAEQLATSARESGLVKSLDQKRSGLLEIFCWHGSQEKGTKPRHAWD